MQQIKHISMIIVSTILGGIASYLYHPIMNHYLTVFDFARFESLASMFTILITITSAFGLYLTRTFSHTKNKELGGLYRGSQRVFVFVGIGMYVLYLLCIDWIDSLLAIGSLPMVAMIGLVIPLGFLSISPNSWVQARGKFGFLSIYSIITSFGKLLFGWLLVWLGFSVFGAIGGFLLSSFCATLFLLFWMRASFRGDTPLTYSEVFDFFWKGRLELWHFFLLTFILSLLQNLDLILVNRFFAGDIAGKYALVSVIMKFVIFIALSVETVYYPKLSQPHYDKKDISMAITLLIVGSVVGYILLKLVGYFVLAQVNIVFQEFSDLIVYFYGFCIAFVWVSFFMKIAVAQKIYSVNIFAIVISLGLIAYLEFQVSLTPVEYITAFIVTLLLILFITMIGVFSKYYYLPKKISE